MESVGRMFLCARCRERTVLCSRCDRGQIYCGQSCSIAARVEAQRAAGERYQSGDAGRIHHVERTRRWRLRQKDRCAPGETDTDPVTHQGSPVAPTAAPVLSSSLLPNVERLPAVDVAQTPWICAGCVTAMPAWVRHGFVNRGRARSRLRQARATPSSAETSVSPSPANLAKPLPRQRLEADLHRR